MVHLCPSKMWCTNNFGIRWSQVLFLCSKGPMATFASSKKAYLESFQLWPWPLIDWSTLMIKKNSCNSFRAFLFFRCFDVDFRYFLLLLFILRKTNWHRTIVGPEIDNTFATSGQKMTERRRIGDKEEKMKVMLWFVFAFFLSINKEGFFSKEDDQDVLNWILKKIKHSQRPYLPITHSRQEINYATHALIIYKIHNKFIILNINRDFKSSIPLSAPRFKPSIFT